MTTDLIRTPLYEEHLALGARMVDFAGFEMPVQYAGIMEEHLATREMAGIFDVSHMAQFRVSGEDSKVFLQRMLTNDLDRIDEVGAAQYTLLLDDDGNIIDDLIVYHTGFEYLVIANASNRHEDFAWLSSHVADGVQLSDESDRTALIAVQGPKALEVMGELCGEGWTAPERFHIAAATIMGTIPVLLARTGYTGEDGVEIVLRNEDAATVWRALLSFPEVSPIGLGARDTLRLEMGYHLYGNDMDRTRGPIEARLGWVCPKAKTGYVGEQRVIDGRANGTTELLCHLVMEDAIPRHGYEVSSNGEVIGVIGSGSHSPSLGKGLATAYLPAELAEPGTVVQIHIRKKVVDATVVRPPFLTK